MPELQDISSIKLGEDAEVDSFFRNKRNREWDII